MFVIKSEDSELYYTDKKYTWTGNLQEARTYPSSGGAKNARNSAEKEIPHVNSLNENVESADYTVPDPDEEVFVQEVELREV